MAELRGNTGQVETGDGVRLQYTQTGPPDGPNILFVAGWRQTAAEWCKQVGWFANVGGYRVTTFDFRGQGESEKPPYGYRITRFAADLKDMIEQLSLHEVTIVGHSMGCSSIWAFWDLYPKMARDRHWISKVVLVDQSVMVARHPYWTDEQAEKVSPVLKPGEVYDFAQNMEAMVPGFVRSMFTEDLPEADYEWFLSENKKMSDENAGTLIIDQAFKDWRDILPRINAPTLVIAGEASVFASPGVEWIATQIPGAKCYTFSKEEKGSHFMFWENPEKFNSLVHDFIISN